MLHYSTSYTKLNKLIANNRAVCNLVWSRFQSTTQKTVIDQIKQQAPEIKLEDSLLAVNVKKDGDKQKTFAQLFKESKFVQLGTLEKKTMIGRIVDVVGDDLYIDYGGKFNCVCKRPERNQGLYKRNRNVKIRLRSFELAAYFLNSAKHLTLLESDAELTGFFNADKELDEKTENSILTKAELDEYNNEPLNY